MVLDLIIIGAGPAGIASCLYAARQKLDFICISKDIGGLTNTIPTIKTYLGYHYMSGYELIQKFKQHLQDYEVSVHFEEVKKIEKKNSLFKIKTDIGSYQAKSVIIATGRRSMKLGIPGEKKFDGKGVSFCAACDGPLFKGKTVAIIGGGKSGLLSALYISKLVKHIHLFEHTSKLGGIETWREAVRLAPNITVHLNANITDIFGDTVVKGIHVTEEKVDKTFDLEGVFVEIGYIPNSDVLRGLVKLDKRGYVIIDKRNMSSVPGLFVAGDLSDVLDKQVIISVGEGSKAALSALRYVQRAPASNKSKKEVTTSKKKSIKNKKKANKRKKK